MVGTYETEMFALVESPMLNRRSPGLGAANGETAAGPMGSVTVTWPPGNAAPDAVERTMSNAEIAAMEVVRSASYCFAGTTATIAASMNSTTTRRVKSLAT